MSVVTPAGRRVRPLVSFVALGSNLDDPVAHVRGGLADLARLPGAKLQRASSLYRSAPVGLLDQPHFINAVAQIATHLEPRALLDALLGIEHRHGRTRGVPNGPRTLDLDLLLYGEIVLHEPGLTIPHPRMHERAFVIVPLAEIAPRQCIPGRGEISRLRAAIDTAGLARLPGAPA